MKKLFYILALTWATLANGSELSKLADEIKEIATLADRVTALEEQKPEAANPDPYAFTLRDEDADGYVDAEWESIIAKGQALQSKFWVKAEDYWGSRYASPSGEGWHGSAAMPVIRIVCSEPEYWFKDTARLPGRFQISCPSRWGSLLRFYGDGEHALVDDINYGVATEAPIGIYVEPSTRVQTDNGEMIARPFEQGIERVILQGLNGVMPIYLAMNQDRFVLNDCKILQHKGAQIGVKHGPILRARSYPFPAEQLTEGNVYLTDPRFEDCQMEGLHSGARKQAAIFVSGSNMIFSRLNLYGWNHGIYCHGGEGRVISGLTMHHGTTSDGRSWTRKEDIVAFLLSVRNGANPDAVSAVAGGFKEWILPKRSRVPSAGGWHNEGEACL